MPQKTEVKIIIYEKYNESFNDCNGYYIANKGEIHLLTKELLFNRTLYHEEYHAFEEKGTFLNKLYYLPVYNLIFWVIPIIYMFTLVIIDATSLYDFTNLLLLHKITLTIPVVLFILLASIVGYNEHKASKYAIKKLTSV